jgi:hypothetical protein
MRSIVLASVALFALVTGPAFAANEISFGDDSGEYANDGECDDPRFVGEGMTTTDLLSDDRLKDATDCKAAFDAGKLALNGVTDDGTIDLGDDEGDYANDGECDDMRFTGPGMTTTDLIQEDILHDATDCKTAFDAKRIKLLLK